jgi:hypothetical protein
MSFQGISRSFDPMRFSDARSEAIAGFAPGFIVSMSLRPAIPRRVGLHQCSLVLHRTIVMVKPIAGTRQPPLGLGWGFFSWRNGEFSPGVDNFVGFQYVHADLPWCTRHSLCCWQLLLLDHSPDSPGADAEALGSLFHR